MKIIKIIYVLVFLLSISGCKRYNLEENPANNELIPQKTKINKQDAQKILNLKVNLTSLSEPGKFNIAIPDNYNSGITVYEQGNIGLEFGKINFINRKDVIGIELASALLPSERLCEQNVYVIKEENPNLVSMPEIKKQLVKENNIYYEDANSIIYGENFTVIHYEYDTAAKSYIFYTGEIDHFAKFPEKENMALHMLKNGKNLLKKDFSKIPFNSWEEYVLNSPHAEINVFKSIFTKLNKEMKAFLGPNQSVSPRSEGNYGYVTFYRSNDTMDFAYLNFLNAVKTNTLEKFELPEKISNRFEEVFLDLRYSTSNKYSYSQIDNVAAIKITDPENSDRVHEILICNVQHDQKSFYLITNEVSDLTRDFYIKMFNYYSKNKTLDIPSLKK
ncbi:hypothetical protein [Flavobacterium reichenbachii]|uniref:Uncharacterized protein n=1 Tax=Flavobacterium reichenbachii TaxID=362418 RepID=A0A085ZK93_9FLAO|nr:hypothetical protein [Flavobacterium reichenbachii]KFF04857.1 hypothetical protein IW19_04625 [Flavobacterium reichenbachii]OXB12156.1 hypothetical protein B0A68_19540 [Flavobacterium reichenbachii]